MYEDRFNKPSVSLSDATNIASRPVPAYTSDEGPIDLLITHGPPYARLDKTDRGKLVGCPHLLLAAMNSRPLLHCFGHIHEGWGTFEPPQIDTTFLMTLQVRRESNGHPMPTAWLRVPIQQAHGLKVHGKRVSLSTAQASLMSRQTSTTPTLIMPCSLTCVRILVTLSSAERRL